MPEPELPQFAGEIPVKKGHRAYALPYYTRADGETEILLSNPDATGVSGTAFVFGKDCQVVGRKRIRLGPNCTRGIRLRAIERDNAGHVVVVVTGPILAHVLYARDDLAIVGDSMTGVPELAGWLPEERSRTFAFGYRARPLRGGFAGGSVFVSNPNADALAVDLVYFHEKCEVADRVDDKIKPGCTAEYPFPKNRFGYGRVQVSAPAVINVLHFADERGAIAAAELLAEGDRIEGGTESRERKGRVLLDYTHGCRPIRGDYTQYEAALTGAGYTVSHLTGTLDLATLEKHDVFIVATPWVGYSAAEKSAISAFVTNGGGLLVCQDFGSQPPLPTPGWIHPTREVLAVFGATDDGGMAQDAQHTWDGTPSHLLFETGRNFGSHPIVQPLRQWTVNAANTLSGGAGWATVTETDADATPPLRPALIARPFGAGRVAAIGDSNTFDDTMIVQPQNRDLGVRCVSWLLFEI